MKISIKCNGQMCDICEYFRVFESSTFFAIAFNLVKMVRGFLEQKVLDHDDCANSGCNR